MKDYESLIRNVPDFPKEGIQFKDLTTLWKDAGAFKNSIDDMADYYRDMKIDKIVGAESRGFILGAPLAYLLGAGFVPVRKAGKLPAEKVSKSYDLEYGSATIEIHKDAIQTGEKVLVVDDLLATGGTVSAVIELLESMNAEIAGCIFQIELDFLKGRDMIRYPVQSLIHY